MGLDMYAYVAARAGAQSEYYEAEYGDDESKKGAVPQPREIAYWRKHPNLHGWMHRLWQSKGNRGDFNGDELELTAEDLDQLESDVERSRLPSTTGFFFGSDADQHYKADDLKFIQDARAELLAGSKVFYNSSW